MAHIRSILPQRGGVSPVDNNTTFLAHYDEHAHDNLKGIRHNHLTKCLQFNTTGGNEYVETTLTLPDNGTIELWYYPFSFYDYNSVFENSINANDWECWIYATGVLRFRAGAATGVQYTLPSINNWYHIAVTWEKTGNIKLIVDGVERATAITTWINPGSLILGGKLNTKSQGKMSDVRVWNYAKTAAQVSKSMSNLSGEDSAGLVARYKLDEGSGQIAYDYSTTGADGVITGGTWVEGRAVYSLMSGGYPGGTGKGVLIEEATTNMVTNPTDPSTWVINKDVASGYISHSIIDTEFGVKGLSKTVASTGNSYLATLNQMPYTGTVNMSSPVTMSVYARASNPDGGAVLHFNYEGKDSGGVRKDVTKSFVLNHTDWRRYDLTSTLADAGFATLNGTLKMYTYTTDGTQRTIDIVMPQLEQKAYSTSFVKGYRDWPHLAYPKDVINPTEGTISFWLNPLKKNPNSYPSIMGLGGWSNPYSVDWLSIYWGSGWNSANSISLGIANGTTAGGVQLSAPSVIINPDSWMYVVARWDFNTQDKVTFTVWDSTGVKRESSTALSFEPPTFANQTAFYVGHSKDWNSTSAPNAEFDELRIDKVYRSDAEITSWYYQGRNGW